MASPFRACGINKGYSNGVGRALLPDNFDPRTMEDHLRKEFTPEKMHSRSAVLLANQIGASKRVGIEKSEVLSLVEQIFSEDDSAEERQ